MLTCEPFLKKKNQELDSIDIIFNSDLVTQNRENGVLNNPDNFTPMSEAIADFIWMNTHKTFTKYGKTVPVFLRFNGFDRDIPENMVSIFREILIAISKMRVYGHDKTGKLDGENSPYYWTAAFLRYHLVRQLMIQAEFTDNYTEKAKLEKTAQGHVKKLIKGATETKKIYADDYTLGASYLCDSILSFDDRSADTASLYITSYLFKFDRKGKYKGILQVGENIRDGFEKIKPDVYYQMAQILGYAYRLRDSLPYVEKALAEEKKRRGGNDQPSLFDENRFRILNALAVGLKAKRTVKIFIHDITGIELAELIPDNITIVRNDYIYAYKNKRYVHMDMRVRSRSLFEYIEIFLTSQFTSKHMARMSAYEVQADNTGQRVTIYKKS